MNIPVTQIAVIDRGRKDLGDIQDLANAISRDGQITAGVVRTAVDEDTTRWGIDPLETPFVLVAGERRYRACIFAGLDTFLAIDRGELEPLQQKVLELEENLHRKDLTAAEEVLMKDEIFEIRKAQAVAAGGPVYTQRDLAVELNETAANTSRDLKLAAEIKKNPELRLIKTKAAAIRVVDYKAALADRAYKVASSPVFQFKDKIVTADMKGFVRLLPENSIDLCFTDFPFGIDYRFDDHDRNKYADSGESLKDLLTDMVPEILRVTRPTGWLALMMGSTHYEFLRDSIEDCCVEHYAYRLDTFPEICNRSAVLRDEGGLVASCQFLEPEDPEWIWFRPNSRNPSIWPEKHAQNQYEKLCVVNMGSAVMVRRNLGNVLVHDAVYTDRDHEMQRPPALCEDVITRLTVGGERVLDLCFGSGQHLASAAKLQRDFLGCDINPKNLETALVLVAENYVKPANA